MAVLFIKKVPADAAAKMGRLMLLALEYKLDSVCNAEKIRGTGDTPVIPWGYAQKSITRTV